MKVDAEVEGWGPADLKEVAVAVEDGGDGAVAQVDHSLHRQVLEPHFHRGGLDVGTAAGLSASETSRRDIGYRYPAYSSEAGASFKG